MRSTRSVSARTVLRDRPSRSRSCRAAAAASRSNASPRDGEEGRATAPTTSDGRLSRHLDGGLHRRRVRRRAVALHGLRSSRVAMSAAPAIRVVGTAGHVDHGKSALITALTGTDPDRLREERERGMTIDLGFAWMTTPSGHEIGFIDVPGHQDFIRNMLAGVGGIDAVLLVVAADEGVRPQTREHLAILGLLGIDRGVVALTKRDLVDDTWAALARDELTAALADTPLASARIVEVSAKARAGLDALIEALEEVLAAAPQRRVTGRPRLPVDRSFTMAGFGTVVTGTLLDGDLHVGEEIELVPGGARARIRGLQTHRRAIDVAAAGSRVAANLSGIDKEAIARGMVVTQPGTFRPTQMLALRLRVLPDGSIEQDEQVKVHV